MMRMSRSRGDKVVVDGPATVHIDGMSKGKVQMRVEAPRSTTIEIQEAPRESRTHQRRPR